MRLDYQRLSEAVGRTAGPSRWILIDQARVDGFADLTEDRQWIHVDPGNASSGPFGGTIAHGFLTLSLASCVLEELVTVEGSGLTVNYGLDRVRFPAPVTVGSRVRGELEVVGVAPRRGGWQVTYSVTFVSDAGPTPACVAELLLCYFPSQDPPPDHSPDESSGSRLLRQSSPTSPAADHLDRTTIAPPSRDEYRRAMLSTIQERQTGKWTR